MICVVSHDAGGAEVLASYVAQHDLAYSFVLAGPAIAVFERRLGHLPLSSLEEAVANCDWLLCGTGWQSDLEWTAIGMARQKAKRSIAFLDHWVRYRERFIRRGIEQFPDEIWVGDSLAEMLALKCLPGLPVCLVPNPYFEDLRKNIASLGISAGAVSYTSGLRVLFVCESISEHGLREFGDELHWGYTEHDALRYFLLNLHALGKPVTRVIVRPHPSDPVGKYGWVSREFGNNVKVGGGRTLLEEIVESDVVVGCETMAMVVGLIAGRRVISCVPPGGKACALPQPEIESLQLLLASENQS